MGQLKHPVIQNKRVLVTGGAGFIGSNLCESLLQNNNEVLCLDNFATGKRLNIEEFFSNKNFKLLEGDIRDLGMCRKAVNGADYVLHQAALGSVPRSIEDPISTNEVNISGFLNMLVAARDANVKRFVYASSSSVYGDHPDLPKVEKAIGRPLSPYAITKLTNEHYANVFGSLYEMPIIGLRYFNVFGKKQDPDGAYAAAIPKFIKHLVTGKSPVIFGDGLQSRDFTYVQNVVQMNHLAALAESKKALNTVYNTAYSEKITLNQLFQLLSELLSQYDAEIRDIRPTYAPERKGDIRHSLASIDKAKNLLGYSPKFDLQRGMTESIKWYWENLC